VNNVRIVGAGAFIPRRAIGNERLAKAIPGWSPQEIEERTGIFERRFLWDFEVDKGRAIAPPEDSDYFPACNTDMCEVALRRALDLGRVDARELDAIFLVTSTPDQLNFSHDAMELHRRLGCHESTFALVIDGDAGSTPYAIDLARRMIQGDAFQTIAVIGSSFVSPMIDREVFTSELVVAPGREPLDPRLSAYLFGDGAGAIILRGERGTGLGMLASMSGNAHADLVQRTGGGLLKLPYPGRALSADQAFVLDEAQLELTYPIYMKACIDVVLADHLELAGAITRYYLHAPSKRLIDRFIQTAGLPPERVPCDVQRYGNTSAAGTLVLLAEDVATGTVELGSGDLVLLAAVGANVQYGAQLVRL
jgi:3-oxoacyl-[acyl-carrier-protein] synthase III